MAPTPGPIQNAVGQIITESPNFLIPPRKNTTVSNKGLLNMPGQNNCFLNSAVQVLWHLDSFRRSFRDLSGHSCMAESCIFCALKELFTQFQYSQESALPPDALRHALAKTFCDQRRFQLGFMDDAAECFENILLRIHVHIADQDTEDMCGNVNCIPHRKFAMTLVEQRLCQNCSAASEPLPFNQMVHYVTTSALCSKALEMQHQDPNYLLSFGKLLRLAGEMGEARECPSGCGEKVQAYKTLMNHPDVVSIGLVWDSECPTLQHIMDVLQNIGMYLRLQEMFHNVCDYQRANSNVHQLVGIVTYYGKHYSTFFFHTKLGIWIYFDDATVQEIGPSWNLVVEKCQRGRFQPLLLLFANLNSSSSTDNRDNLNNVTYANCGMNQVGNQRQSIINQYLKLQNSQSVAATRGYGQMKMTNSYHDAQGLYRYNPTNSPSTKYAHDIFTYNQNRTLPVYSNLQYLNNLVPANPTKLSEAAFAAAMEGEQLDFSKKDFDGAKDSDSAFTEDDRDVSDLYISRRAVENVLQQQKRHMCRSYSQIGNRNSSSSLESFDTAQQINKVVSAPLESNPLARRDSGSWSGDRASSSSNNSVENPFLAVVASKRLLLGLNKKSLPDSNSSDHGYDSFSVSSSDSYPSINGSPVKVEPRLTQIPEDWLPEEEDLNEKLKMVTADSSSAPDCDKLCAEADLLLAKSYDKEKDGDIVMAALLCDSAAARARAAMEAPYNNSRSLVSAKMKHSTCVLRSSNLYRRLKDHEMDERRKQKNHTGHHSRQSSRDSTHARHSRQNSKDSTHSKTSGSKDNSDEVDHFGKNIEIYGTLPKKGGRKKNTSMSTLKNKDDAVYRNFLEMQRKNTNLSNELNETMLKNVDLPSNCKVESSPKRKNQINVEKNKSHKEIVPPKSPVKKKETPKSDTETKKKQQKPQISLNNTPNERKSEVEFTCRDLLSPIPAPDRKPHKIKRKLMGNFMKRKNRSLPDLREDPTSTDPMDCFLDDAVIQAPSMILPNGKSRKPTMPVNGTFASVNRGFHQPHHAFIKKDLTQRPLLMKVNPPNIQTPDMNNSETKTINALPAIPKRTSELSSKMDAMNNKPSRIPFITKSDSSLPTFHANKSVIDPKLSPCRPALPKPSAIPVLTPQVSISPINPQENLISRFGQTTVPEACTSMNDKEDLPPPTNSFLAEIQAKRKQVLNKPTQKQEPLKHIATGVTENKELSILPKLALQAEGTSWLKELQSKQQKIISKQVVDLPKQGDLNEKSTVSTDCNGIENIRSRAMELKNGFIFNRKLHSEVSSDAVRCPNNVPMNDVTTSSTVRNLASRFEKVLKKPNDVALPLMETDSIQTNITTKNVQTVEGCLEKKPESSVPLHHNLTRSLSNTSIGVTFQLKSALKVKTGVETCETDSKNTSFPDAITKTTKPILKSSPNSLTISNSTESSKTSNANVSKPLLPNRSILNMEPLREQKPIQSVLKPSLPPSPTATSFHVIPPSSSNQCRPMQPPDYATALQRLELIRTSNGEGNTQLLDPESCAVVTKDGSKKKSKKSVTFSDEVVLVACAEYDEINFSSNPLFERVYQQHLESGKGEIPLLSNTYGNMHSFENESSCDDGLTNNINSNNCSAGSSNSQCDLCHNKQVLHPNNYCTDCEFYLSRFKA